MIQYFYTYLQISKITVSKLTFRGTVPLIGTAIIRIGEIFSRKIFFDIISLALSTLTGTDLLYTKENIFFVIYATHIVSNFHREPSIKIGHNIMVT